jgi:hypothetical protein
MVKIIVILLLLLFCAVLAATFVWLTHTIVQNIIEIWWEIKE